MNCSRCEGLMREHFLDFHGTIGHMWASGHRCMNCGNVYDPGIEQHRVSPPQPVLVFPYDESADEADELDGEMPSIVMDAA